MIAHNWLEDEYTPRRDILVDDFGVDSDTLPVAHPEWFRDGDIVRVGEEDRYDTGEREPWSDVIGWDEGPRLSYEEAVKMWAFEVFRVRNEAVEIIDAKTMTVARAIGSNPARRTARGGSVTIIAAGVQPMMSHDLYPRFVRARSALPQV